MTKTKSYRIDERTQKRLDAIRKDIEKDNKKMGLDYKVDETLALRISIAWYAKYVCGFKEEGL